MPWRDWPRVNGCEWFLSWQSFNSSIHHFLGPMQPMLSYEQGRSWLWLWVIPSAIGWAFLTFDSCNLTIHYIIIACHSSWPTYLASLRLSGDFPALGFCLFHLNFHQWLGGWYWNAMLTGSKEDRFAVLLSTLANYWLRCGRRVLGSFKQNNPIQFLFLPLNGALFLASDEIIVNYSLDSAVLVLGRSCSHSQGTVLKAVYILYCFLAVISFKFPITAPSHPATVFETRIPVWLLQLVTRTLPVPVVPIATLLCFDEDTFNKI